MKLKATIRNTVNRLQMQKSVAMKETLNDRENEDINCEEKAYTESEGIQFRF